jgi:hypothetical protein
MLTSWMSIGSAPGIASSSSAPEGRLMAMALNEPSRDWGQTMGEGRGGQIIERTDHLTGGHEVK